MFMYFEYTIVIQKLLNIFTIGPQQNVSLRFSEQQFLR